MMMPDTGGVIWRASVVAVVMMVAGVIAEMVIHRQAETQTVVMRGTCIVLETIHHARRRRVSEHEGQRKAGHREQRTQTGTSPSHGSAV